MTGTEYIYTGLALLFHLFFLKRLIVFFLCEFRYDADDCEIDSEGDDDDVNGNEDGEGGGNEDDSEEGWLRTRSCNNCK